MNQKVLSKLLKIPIKESKLIIDFVDLDGDNLLDEYDFICMVGLFTQTSYEEKLETIFSLFDSDLSQLMSYEELERLVKCILSINENGSRDVGSQMVKEKIKQIQEMLFLDDQELKLADFLVFTREDEEFQSALLKIGILTEKDLMNICDEDLENEFNRGTDKYRNGNQEQFEKRKLGLDMNYD